MERGERALQSEQYSRRFQDSLGRSVLEGKKEEEEEDKEKGGGEGGGGNTEAEREEPDAKPKNIYTGLLGSYPPVTPE